MSEERGRNENRRRRKRRRTGWDPAPADPSNIPPEGDVAHQFSMYASAQQRQLTAARRIYVGSINFELNEDDIQRAFGPFGPITSITMSRDVLTQRHKGFCFVEYASPESADMALAVMNGFVLGGRPLKVGPPNANASSSITAVTVAPHEMDKARRCLAIANDAVRHIPTADSPRREAPRPSSVVSSSSTENRVYVGSVYWELSEEEVAAYFSSIGKIKSCSLVQNAETGKHKGYGFIEFEDASAARRAIELMNGFEIAGRPIKVGRCTSLSMPSSNVAAPAQYSVLPVLQTTGDGEATLDDDENMSIRGQDMRFQLMQKLRRGSSIESRVVVIKDMIDAEEIDDDLKDEVASECAKFGVVIRVLIYKDDDEGVKVFVVFSSPREAEFAVQKLDKRYFAGRVIQAAPYPEDKFNEEDYTM